MSCCVQVLEVHAARTEDCREGGATTTTTTSSSCLSREQAELLAHYQSSFDDEQVDHELVLSLLEHLADEPPGAVLVFLPGYEDIITLRSSAIPSLELP